MQEITDQSNEKWIINCESLNVNVTQQYIHFFKNILNPFVSKLATFFDKRLNKFQLYFFSIIKTYYSQLILHENHQNFLEIFQYESQMTLVMIISNILLSKIYMLRQTIIRLMKEYQRNKTINQQKTFVHSQKMLVFKNIIIDYIAFFTKTKTITKVFFRKWFYGKFNPKLLKARGKRKIENYLIKRQSTFYIERKDSIRLLMLYQRIKLLSRKYDLLWFKTHLFVQVISQVILAYNKEAKSTLLYLLTPDLTVNELNKIKLHLYYALLSLNNMDEVIRGRIESEIKKTQLRMLPEHNEAIDNHVLTHIFPLSYKKSLLNQTIVHYFSKWNHYSMILNITETRKMKSKLTDLIIYSKMFLMVLVLRNQLKSALEHFRYCLKRYYLLSPITIYSLENITNAKLVGIIDGLVKMYYFLISSDYHKRIAPKSLQGDVYWNRRNRQFYLWRYLNYWVVPHRFVIGLTIINEYNVDLVYKYKHLFLAMLKSNATKIHLLSKVSLVLNSICDNITMAQLPYLKYSFFEKFKLQASNRNQQRHYYYKTSITFFISTLIKIYSKDLLKKMHWKAYSTSVKLLHTTKKKKGNKKMDNKVFLMINKVISMRLIMAYFIRSIYLYCFSDFYSFIKAFNKKHYYHKRGKLTIDNRIVLNMTTVTLSIHNDIHSRAKMLKRVKLTKAMFLITEKHTANKHVKLALIHAFKKWKAFGMSVIHSIIEDKEFQLDIKLKISEYEEGIEYYEENLGKIAMRCEKCQECSKLLRASYSDQGQGQGVRKTKSKNNNGSVQNEVLMNHIELTQPKLNIHDENENDILDDDENGEDGYFAYLEKTEDELKTKIFQLRNEKHPLCEELKKEVEELCKEVDDLSNVNNKK